MLSSSSLLGTRSEVSTLHGVRLKPYALLQGGFKKPCDLLHSPSPRTLRQQTSFCLVPLATHLTQVFLHRMSSAIIVLWHLHSNVLLAPAFTFNVPWHKHPHLSCFCTRITFIVLICVSASFRRYLGFSRVKSYRSLIQSWLMQGGMSESCTPILSGYPSADASYTPIMAGGSAEGFPIAPGSPWGWALSRLHMQTESASAIHKLTFSRPRGTSVRENRVCGSAVIDDRSLSLLTLMSTPPPLVFSWPTHPSAMF
ncbi:hypothetical protein R3P38DRAFT_3105366 [Favolaschia claudopus]|uniref:Cytochrome c biogenesis B n=1 Tax=Favolaschia claudopus TaxID=2862362 RepID=A0AAV9ZJ99_9AGAR